ncbi:MAG: LysR family transcriptional regulator [Deltaproteobacteria bacterium]|nr:LysR family transcriptional regulator [Deltaproteobacteria bacterium]
MPTLLQLQYALAVDEQRHFGKAALACHVSQPTLSQQLQKLEDDVRLVLFDRARKPILVTPEGRQFLEQARTVLREYERLLQVAQQAPDGSASGDFKLAIIPTVASHLLPYLLKPFTRAHPRVRLLIEEAKTETILDELARDRLDGAVLATPVAATGLKVHPLYYEPFLAYFAAGHALLRHDRITRDQLDPAEMWLLQDGHCFKDQVLNFCAVPGQGDVVPGNVRFESGSLDTLRRLVRGSQGHTLIPALMAQGLPREERDAHVRPFRAPVPAREISIVYRRDHWKLAILRALEECVAQCIPASVPRRPERNLAVLDAC